MYDVKRMIPVAFYPYTSIVQDRILEVENYNEVPSLRELREELIEHFNDNGISCTVDNKIVFEVDVKGVRLFIGFKDWNFAIGFSVVSDSWIVPKRNPDAPLSFAERIKVAADSLKLSFDNFASNCNNFEDYQVEDYQDNIIIGELTGKKEILTFVSDDKLDFGDEDVWQKMVDLDD